MYLINYLSLQAADQRYIAAFRFRVGQHLNGPINGSNVIFTVPSGEKFTHNLPFLTIQVYYNGVRLTLLDDFTVTESGGMGTGYDRVTLEIAPKVNDKVLVDYILQSV